MTAHLPPGVISKGRANNPDAFPIFGNHAAFWVQRGYYLNPGPVNENYIRLIKSKGNNMVGVSGLKHHDTTVGDGSGRIHIANRNAGIDLIRAIGIFLVMGMHLAGTLPIIGAPATGLSGMIAHAFGHGYYGVTIFFVISGYLITMTNVRPSDAEPRRVGINVAAFYIRRATRILPLLFATLLLGAVFLYGVASNSVLFHWVFSLDGSPFGLAFWLSQLTFSFNWFRILSGLPEGGWGMHWDIVWSLAVEEQFYLLFPVVVLLCGTLFRMRLLLVLAVVVSAAVRGYLLYQGQPWLESFTNTFACCDALAIGSLTALSRPVAPSAGRIVGWFGVAIAITAYLVGYKPVLGLMGTVISIGTAMMIQWARVANPGNNLLIRAVSRFGQLSFGLYLLHPVVIFFLMQPLAQLPFAVALGVFLAATYLVAQASFSFFELPVERSSRRRLLASIQQQRSPAQEAPNPLVG